MNRHIELVSDHIAIIGDQKQDHDWIRCTIDQDGTIMLHAGGDVRLNGSRRQAMLDVLHCGLCTGSFAALADTSKELFVGKQVRGPGNRGAAQVADLVPPPAKMRVVCPDCKGTGYAGWFVCVACDGAGVIVKLPPVSPPRPSRKTCPHCGKLL